ncbi:hypothetical protein V5O48_005045 [Marasmius crinis-equi]|uniref:Uncharacterized protein n=1 Tax=Marasmius crinis-equi TaxID=585013 RepID=A0ABR3FND2_9AGAR
MISTVTGPAVLANIHDLLTVTVLLMFVSISVEQTQLPAPKVRTLRRRQSTTNLNEMYVSDGTLNRACIVRQDQLAVSSPMPKFIPTITRVAQSSYGPSKESLRLADSNRMSDRATKRRTAGVISVEELFGISREHSSNSMSLW